MMDSNVRNVWIQLTLGHLLSKGVKFLFEFD